ncbi:DUF2534 family protein [Salmonella enterica]|uniref:DUF2534 family protein n=1 Tax=Salmonella enterica TaxID=28901 RepID=UPI000A18858A|nr:hypothetical protein K795_19063 [Salmonella enterica subsp. enterica serovar Newport str. SHSN005]OSJ65792.1 hypothetical protein K796_16572 [Salmonella enterica subsp. enterica serovar Newport str. SHSN006]OSJ86696.1 hypothetical protein K801_17550 [Salmonella enterica subsp. enterica serovar Newport str. SHSN011]
MIKEKLKTRNGKRFLFSVAMVFIIAASVMTRATIGGVIWQYNIELKDWTLSIFIIQSAMIFFTAWSLLFCFRYRSGFFS